MKMVLAGPYLELRREEDLTPAFVLAVAVHVLLVAALMLGVRWQSHAPDVVTVELWQPPPPPPPQAAPEPPKPAPVVQPAPQPKPEPRLEKPDIAIKALPKPKPKPAPEPKPAPKPVPKPAAKPAPPPPDDRLAQQLLREELAREQQLLAAERERQAISAQLARDAAAARNRAMDTYVSKIRGKVRGNIVLPPDIQGDPEALILVTQLPTGEVLQAKLVISSGHAAYDDAVLRAILKSSPLPKPDSPTLFQRELKLTFRPKD
ncbi:MAG: energy transducer TonB [Proteobacteria bacterium]|nr:energy transducer TonB [Pseudomonadota bacterium]